MSTQQTLKLNPPSFHPELTPPSTTMPAVSRSSATDSDHHVWGRPLWRLHPVVCGSKSGSASRDGAGHVLEMSVDDVGEGERMHSGLSGYILYRAVCDVMLPEET